MPRTGLDAQVSPYGLPELTVSDAAAMLRVNAKIVRRAISEGRLPAFRVGRLIRVRAEDVAALVTPIRTTTKRSA